MAGPIKPIASSAQVDLGFESDPEQMQRKKPADPGYKEIHEKYNPSDKSSKAAENEEFKDKRQPKSPLIRQEAINQMKQMMNMAGAAGSGVDIEGKTGRNIKPKLKSGGKVSASSRADGIAQRGKTRGRIV